MQGLSHHHIEYAGFLRRALAFWLDALMISLISSAVIIMLFGLEYFQQISSFSSFIIADWRITAIEQALPALWAIGFWFAWQATPGKLLLDCKVVDASTAQRAGLLQLIIRYLGYIVSSLPLGLGFLWVLVDKRNQGWHDKLSNTLVIMQDESLASMESYR